MYSDRTFIELAYRFVDIDIPAYIDCVNYHKRLIQNQDIPEEIRYNLIMDKYDKAYNDSCYSVYEDILDANLPPISSFSSPDMYSYAKTFQDTSSALQDLLLDSISFFESAIDENIDELEGRIKNRDSEKALFNKLLVQMKDGYYKALLSLDGKDPLKACDFLYNVLTRKYLEIEKFAEKEARRLFHRVDYSKIINSFTALILIAKGPFEEVQYLCELNLKVNKNYLDFIFCLREALVQYMELCDSKKKIYQFLKSKSENRNGDITQYNSLVQSSNILRDKYDKSINALLPQLKSLLDRVCGKRENI